MNTLSQQFKVVGGSIAAALLATTLVYGINLETRVQAEEKETIKGARFTEEDGDKLKEFGQELKEHNLVLETKLDIIIHYLEKE
jgi:hypothetical protein